MTSAGISSATLATLIKPEDELLKQVASANARLLDARKGKRDGNAR